jgi:predicted short-subunit dehydrogenase-like oxidoreductase (DUF2520 family)
MPRKSPRTSPKPPASARKRRPVGTKSATRSPKPQTRRKLTISIVGPGRLGSALTVALHNAGFVIDEIVTNGPGKARGLARSVGARAVAVEAAALDSDIVWITVGDSAIREAAHQLAATRGDWTGKVVFHSSGALISDELALLKSHGAATASVHPLMTFSGGKPPSLVDVSFAIEGDAHGTHAAEAIVRALGGAPVRVRPEDKAAYHTWASFGSPLLVALLATAEKVGALAGLDVRQARPALIPLLQQTLDNYGSRGADEAFTGALVRGDVETVRKHLEVLQKFPEARETYVALARAALHLLPVANRRTIGQLLDLPYE